MAALMTRGLANVSAVIHQGDLWVSWDARLSAAGESPSYPNARCRIAHIAVDSAGRSSRSTRAWNPDYAFAYCCLASGEARVS
jgi:hypothetical protein